MHRDLEFRSGDLKNLINGLNCRIKILQYQTSAINKKKLEATVLSIESNFRSLVDKTAAQERSGSSIEIMQIIFSGSFAFDFIDRLDGDETLGFEGVDVGNGAVNWINTYIRNPIASIPGLWFVLNMIWLYIFAQAIRSLMRYLAEEQLGAMSARFVVNRYFDNDFALRIPT